MQTKDKAYELSLPPHVKVHNVFHLSLLKRYVPNANHILKDELTLITKEGTLEITPKVVLQIQTCTIWNRTINEYLIKWTSYLVKDATWERKDLLVTNDYPDFFLR